MVFEPSFLFSMYVCRSYAVIEFEALVVVTLDTMNLGWRPHDLETSYLPFAHGTGCAVGLTDPVFMAKIGMEPWGFDRHVEFPYTPVDLERKLQETDEEAEEARKRKVSGSCWLGEVGRLERGTT